jgi:cytochrome c oxidase subunit III
MAPWPFPGAAQKRVMATLNEPIRERVTLDVSGLPSVAFGHRNTTWLANVFYMTIEGMMFALMIATYFYLRTRSSSWPPGHYPPALTFGMTNLVIFVVSVIPARWVQKRAPSGDRTAIRNGLLILALFGLAATAVRVFEFTTLNCKWSDDAYSSAVWVLIGLHSGHLVTELIETLVLFVIACTPRMEGTRLADAAINSDYWYFVVLTGLVVDFLIYGTTRFL